MVSKRRRLKSCKSKILIGFLNKSFIYYFQASCGTKTQACDWESDVCGFDSYSARLSRNNTESLCLLMWSLKVNILKKDTYYISMKRVQMTCFFYSWPKIYIYFFIIKLWKIPQPPKLNHPINTRVSFLSEVKFLGN